MTEDAPKEGPAARFVQRCFEPIDNASLVAFRVVLAGCLLFEHVRFWGSGIWQQEFHDTVFHLKYYGFAWVEAFPPAGLNVVYLALAISCVMVLVGAFYRVGAVIMFSSWTYLFLLDATTYRNHHYLLCLLAAFLIFLPAHRSFSVDARRNPSIRTDTTPRWTVDLLRFQMLLVYFFAGVAKLDPDWISGRVIKTIFAAEDHPQAIAEFLQQDWVGLFFAWSGLLFDLLVGFALLWKRTRLWAFLAAGGFHLTNGLFLVSVGIFPWFALLASTIFFEPNWPRTVFSKFFTDMRRNVPVEPAPNTLAGRHYGIALVLIVYAAIQIALPFRQHLYPGRTSWTHEGHRWAWRMKLVDKQVVTFKVTVVDPATGTREDVQLRRLLAPWQIDRVAKQPDLLLQFVRYCDRTILKGKDYPIYAYSLLTLNRHRAQLLVDPNVDLRHLEWSLAPKDWLLPFEPDPR
ncbi:MAG: HTTM domain-containing protein [Planctomycetota bacterium]